MKPKQHVFFIAGNARSLVANRGDLISDMLQAGHKVSAAVPAEDMLDSVYELDIDIHPFRLGRTGMNPIKDIGMMLRLCSLIRRVKPDMIFAYTIKPVIWGTFAAQLAGVKQCYAMITGLGTIFIRENKGLNRVRRTLVVALYRVAISSATKVFFQNPDDLANFQKYGILRDPQKAVRTMGSGVNLARFNRAELPKEKIVFLFIGRLLREKGVAEFCEAAAALKPIWPEARFVAVGPYDPDLPHSVDAQDLEQWKATGAVEFVGGVPDVRPWLAQSSVFVLPSYREGTPRSALEAMATGRAIITTDTPGCRETVQDGENGFLVPPRDPDALAAAMEHFLKQPELIEKMGASSYNRVQKDYDVRNVNHLIMQTMELI